MKKFYAFLCLSITGLTFAQTPVLTGIMDGDCSGGNPKVLEIYANGTVNFADYSLENQTNAATTWGNTLSLAPLQTRTNSFVYVVYGDPAVVGPIFAAEFPEIPSSDVFITGTSPTTLNINGDDRVRIINSSTLAVIDQYGAEGVDGSGTAWEYLDSWAKRNNGTGPDGATFVPTNWTYGGVDNSTTTPNGALNGLGVCQQAAAFTTVVPFGDYSLGTARNDISGLSLYPNPVLNGNLYITTSNNNTKSVVIYDVLGKVVLKTVVNEQPVNVSNLNGGVYVVKVTEDGKTATRKLVIR